MIDPALRSSLAAFDDAALATLANPGLVRRAHRDLEEGKLRLVSSAGGKAEVEADGQLVTMDARGPRGADCACKSVAMCRHRIAAVLFLLTVEAAAESPAEAAPEAPGDPRELAAALDPAALERWAGKASWRAALELVAEVQTVAPQPNAIAVTFEGLDDPVLILRGQGFDGIVSKAAKPRQKALHAAAVLAARRHFGLALPEAEEDPALAQAAAPLEADPAFLARVAQALGEVASLGFNLAPVPLEESLFELSVSSRADSLPRLAAMLRAIAAQVRLRRQRSLAFDPDAMLELAATALALTRALRGGAGERQVALAGKVRRDFAPAPRLSLIGCGGERWRSAAGARGVTAWFVEPETGQWLSTTLARGPGQDPQFMPGEAWQHQALWQAAPLAQLAHARFELEGANISADGRLSAPAAARATIAETGVVPAANQRGVIRDWAELRPAFLRQSGLGLDAVAAPAVCLLAPAASAPPYFDDFTQQLVWPLRDASGAWLALTLDHEEPVAVAIAALEASVRSGWQGLVLAKLSREGESLAVSPVTLFGGGDPVDLSLWHERRGATTKTAARGWLERLRPRAAQRLAKAPRGGTQAALSSAWRQVLDRAEAGPGLAATLDAGLAAQSERLDSYGLPVLAALLRQAGDAEGLLIAAYGLLVARQQRCEVPLLV
jgi:hypothetical protein